jgi:nucleotide-binding universal stress UspA family protein
MRILVPVDFTDHSRRALETARSLISKDGTIILAHVVASPIHPSFYAGGVTRLFQLDPELPQRIEATLQEWLGDQPGEIIATEGDVHSEIMRVSEERNAQLIVIGTRGLSGVNHFLMGSTTEKVVRASKIPVLTVK